MSSFSIRYYTKRSKYVHEYRFHESILKAAQNTNSLQNSFIGFNSFIYTTALKILVQMMYATLILWMFYTALFSMTVPTTNEFHACKVLSVPDSVVLSISCAATAGRAHVSPTYYPDTPNLLRHLLIFYRRL